MTTLQKKATLPEIKQEGIFQQEDPFPYSSNPLLDKLDDRELKTYKITVFIVYLLAYIYSSAFVNFQPIYFFPLALALIGLNQFLSRRKQGTGQRLETVIFGLLTLGQALALSIWGFRSQLEIFQFLALHASFIFYLAAKNGWLVQGRLGIMIWFDAVNNSVVLPFKHFPLAFQVILQDFKSSQKEADNQSPTKLKQLAFILLSIGAALLLVNFAWAQLIHVSEKFASLTDTFSQNLYRLLADFFDYARFNLFIIKVTVSLPVSLWLYSLMLGGILAKKDFLLTYNSFHHKIKPLRVFPQLAAYIVIGSLCLIYGLFFAVAVSELGSILSLNEAVSPQNASTVAVSGFWQLVRVSLLNFAVLGAFYLLADKPLWDRKGTHLALTLLFTFASLFALLAGWKLFGIYIFFYGPTPLRLLSGWFILVLLVWCLLTLIRLYRPIQAIRLGTLYAFISFTLLCYLYGFLIP